MPHFRYILEWSERMACNSHIQLPKCVLKHFSESSGRVFYLDVKTGNIGLTSAAVLGTEYGFFSDEQEAYLSKEIESPIALVASKVRTFIKKDKGLNEEILLLKGSALEKTIKHYSVRYSLDGFIKLPESNMGLVEGWAFSFYNEPVQVYVIDQDEKKVDMAKEVRVRKDLVDYKYAKKGQENCGFSIKFPYNESMKYYLVIESGEFRKVFDIAKINHVPMLIRVKRKAAKINRKNVKRGFTYLRKRGVVQTV